MITSEFALELYLSLVQEALPIALVFGICNLIVGWLFNIIFNRGEHKL